MRIDAFGTNNASPVTEQASTSPAFAGTSFASTATALPEDKATFTTTEGVSVESLRSEVMATAATRQTRVDSLRTAVASGQYTVDPDAVAQAMIEESF